MSSRLRVVVVDDHPLFRAGVVKALDSSDKFEVVGEGASADDAIALVASSEPDVLLMDLQLPGGGLEAAEAIAATSSAAKIIVLTVVNHVETVERAFRTGVSGFLVKGIGAAEMVGAVEAVARGECYVSPECVRGLLDRLSERTREPFSPPEKGVELAQREEEILSRVAQGLSNKQIAFELGVAERTVKYCLTQMMRKLDARNRVEVAMFAARRPGPTDSLPQLADIGSRSGL